ncbi:MAG: hypothetical protein HY886_01335 [Deltaproteobacteria bacterium]|nr:hypothetical protein [Deltaproteobacteria bacterium]
MKKLSVIVLICVFFSAGASLGGSQYQAGGAQGAFGQAKRNRCKECHQARGQGRGAPLAQGFLPEDHTFLKKRKDGNPSHMPLQRQKR